MHNSKLFWKLPLFLIANFLFSQHSLSMTLRHYQVHQRYQYGHMLLILALKAMNVDVTLQPIDHAETINEARGSQMLKLKQGIDYQFLSISKERCDDFLVISEFPIYQGLLGTRLFLVTKENKDIFADVRTVSDLQKFRGLHGSNWGDLVIYKANNLPVITNPVYENLFRQLEIKRADYFHRGINEIWQDYEERKDKLEIANHIALFYLHPTLFLLNKEDTNLAELIRKGLEKTKRDGSQDRLFLEFHGDMLKKAKLEERRLIIIKNPANLGTNIPFVDTSLWMPKHHAEMIKRSELY